MRVPVRWEARRVGEGGVDRLRGYAGLLLAAGASRRMRKPKGLLNWGGRTLVQHQVATLEASRLDRVGVVLGADVDVLLPLVVSSRRHRVLYNAQHRSGRSSSVVLGTVALSSRAILFCNLDQPLIAETIEELLVAAELHPEFPIVAPLYEGRIRHPVLIRRSLFPEVLSISEESAGLRAVVRCDDARVLPIPMRDPERFLTFNTPSEYERALALARKAGASGS